MQAKSWTPPELFDGFHLWHPIGRGGMGQVYLGRDVVLDRPVAIKFIAAVRPDGIQRQRFLIEARAIARLCHPNVVAVYRAGEVDDHPFLVSEYVEGKCLNQLEKPVPWEAVLRIGIGLTRGLWAAHQNSVLHRDIKPANAILARDGEAKLLDFGLAKLISAQEPTAPAAPSEASGAPVAPSAAITFTTHDGESGVSLRRDPLHAETSFDLWMQSADTAANCFIPQSLTCPGGVLGTPLYMAPEALRGAVATQRSDIYSLGVVLYELCTGAPPRHGAMGSLLPPPLGIGSPGGPPPLTSVAPSVDPRLAVIIDRCVRYDSQQRFASAEALLDALAQLDPDGQAPRLSAGNPYRGLQPFEAEHRELFFGRGAELRAVLERLRASSLVIVAGDSGVGKSSLCRAGVLPQVRAGALGDDISYAVARLVPGQHPLAALCFALAQALGLSISEEEALAEAVREAPATLGALLRRHIEPGRGVLLLCDQLEELLTLSDPDEVPRAAAALGQLGAAPSRVRVVATVRGDFLTRLLPLPGLGEQVARALFLLRPLSAEGVRAAVVGPARCLGVSFESNAMVEELVRAASHDVGELPLLQFTLAELWEARDRSSGIIPATALRALGGVSGALARHADGVLQVLLPEQRVLARRMLTRLVTLHGTRARRTEEELGIITTAAQVTLDALVRGRLVTAREEDGATTYEVAHEALLRGWATLRGWLAADVEVRALRERITAAAMEWSRLGRTPEALWGARQIAEVATLQPDALAEQERAFLVLSRQAVGRQRRGWLALGAGAPLCALLVVGLVVQRDQRHLDRAVAAHLSTAAAQASAAAELGQQARALRAAAYRQFDALPTGTAGGDQAVARALDAAEATFAAAVQREGEAETIAARAGDELEVALLLDPQRSVVRQRMADVLLSRLLAAEEGGRPGQAALLQGRLLNFDSGEARRRALQAPARLALDTTPAGAAVSLEPALAAASGARGWGPRQELGRAPLADLTLAPGSYRLTFTVPGSIEATVLPILLRRGEALRLSVPLPAAGAVPPGYVYVPAGRFLFGSTDPEEVRRSFLSAPPLHEVTTAAYLIGRTEVTYAEWLAFLRALPSAKRAQHTPVVRTLRGSLELRQGAGGRWHVHLQPATAVYEAWEGEPLRYRGRSRRAAQDWLRLPVSGISWQDALAYLGWLNHSGRLPGARLCDEHEWERAARGADDRIFPSGDRLAPDDANFDETYGRDPVAFGPDEVGAHPASASPFNVQDMTGNVWEWTHSVRRSGEAVVRGGSYYQGQLTGRSNNRDVGEATSLRDALVGLRVCADWPLRRSAGDAMRWVQR